MSLADVVNWSCKHCPKMTANLHGYVISCLMDTTDVFIVGAMLFFDNFIQEFHTRNSFSNLKQHYSAALRLGALLSSPT